MSARRWITRLTLSVSATLISLAAVEGVVRAVRDPRPMEVLEQRLAFPAFYPLAEHGLFTRDRDERLRYRLTPGFEMSLDGCRYRINGLGFRGAEPETWSRPEIRRIVLLGDSYAFGLGVDQEQTVAALLEARIRALGEDVAVLNLGVPGYQTGQELALAERLAFSLHPEVVVLLFFGNDQVEEAFHYDPTFRVLYGDPLPIPYAVKGLLGRSALYRWLARAHIHRLRNRGVLSPLAEHNWPVTRDRIEAIARLSRSQGVPLVVANLPLLWSSEALTDPDWPGHTAYDRVSTLATDLDVTLVDLRAALLSTRRSPDDDFLAPLVISADPPIDHHFNPSGNRLLAEAIASTLEDQALVGVAADGQADPLAARVDGGGPELSVPSEGSP
jgi:lysophospholipase L1-like esterase